MKRGGDPSARIAVSAVLGTLLIGAFILFAPSAGAQDVETPTTLAESAPVAAPSTEAQLVKEADAGSALKQDARHFGWPLILAVLVGLFLFFQGQVDRHEPKLADAPLDQGERLRFRS